MNSRVRIIGLTTIALIAFAANSVLGRLALGTNSIDAATFTTLRLVSGAAMLSILSMIFSKRSTVKTQGNWVSATLLFSYAITFSFAYLDLSTATGALILFGFVQVTMIFWALRSGERPPLAEWIGLITAIAGIVYLVSPGVTAPSVMGSILMATAGISWGIYTLRGRKSVNPLADTTGNFLRSAPLAFIVFLIMLQQTHTSKRGILLAISSGALASGIGYAVWYATLKDLTATRAALVQVAGPLLAAIGGIIFMSETISSRLLVSSVLILGGISIAILNQK